MACESPQFLLFGGPDGRTDCGICSGCIRAQAKLNRERQREWFNRMKGRFHNG